MDTHAAAWADAEFLTQHDLSQKLQISERTLEDWRLHDDGPPYLDEEIPYDLTKEFAAAHPEGVASPAGARVPPRVAGSQPRQ